MKSPDDRRSEFALSPSEEAEGLCASRRAARKLLTLNALGPLDRLRLRLGNGTKRAVHLVKMNLVEEAKIRWLGKSPFPGDD